MHEYNLRKLAEKAGCALDELIDFSVCLNPLGPPVSLWADLCRAQETICRYPDPDCGKLRRAAAGFYNCSLEEILAGNGASELIYDAVPALSPGRVILFSPCDIAYEKAAMRAGIDVIGVDSRSETGFVPDFAGLEKILASNDMVILGRPNNPTGFCLENDADLFACQKVSASRVFGR